MGWKTAGKQQLGGSGGASKGLGKVEGALTHAGQWTVARLPTGQQSLVMEPVTMRPPLHLPVLTSGETPPKQTGC